MWDKFSDALMNVAFAGVGAAAIAVEKAGEVGKVLVEKGEEAVEQGRQLNDELQEKGRAISKERQEQRFNAAIAALTAEERQALRKKLDDLDEEERQAAEIARQQAGEDCGNVTAFHCGAPDEDSQDNE
ncbi:hypothetical protein D1159_07075 [Pseudoflavonifractor sp. 524-17]|uniref:hypothetical protein n=1 Tax=Pseudoflavonifractor sp. 524-17 TaxID=2304577 RepID=UPI00137A5C28|nr:hypothetical protein [Pseudoflavonifractor sp. 524-17]NCE64355.1 hypothetical protein [Pseudoflavonifractor sp. 524-17]